MNTAAWIMTAMLFTGYLAVVWYFFRLIRKDTEIDS